MSRASAYSSYKENRWLSFGPPSSSQRITSQAEPSGNVMHMPFNTAPTFDIFQFFDPQARLVAASFYITICIQEPLVSESLLYTSAVDDSERDFDSNNDVWVDM